MEVSYSAHIGFINAYKYRSSYFFVLKFIRDLYVCLYPIVLFYTKFHKEYFLKLIKLLFFSACVEMSIKLKYIEEH